MKTPTSMTWNPEGENWLLKDIKEAKSDMGATNISASGGLPGAAVDDMAERRAEQAHDDQQAEASYAAAYTSARARATIERAEHDLAILLEADRLMDKGGWNVLGNAIGSARIHLERVRGEAT